MDVGGRQPNFTEPPFSLPLHTKTAILPPMKLPLIIQGGMGIGVSSVALARAVSRTGNLGVVSGTAQHLTFVRRLQDGDKSGEDREALAAFPDQEAVAQILKDWFLPEGRPEGKPYRQPPMFSLNTAVSLQKLATLGAFVEVWQAKKGHSGVVGINLLEKLQHANLWTLYGAMLADVDYVLMGAGIPREIPAVLDRLATHQPVSLSIPLENPRAGIENPKSHMNPSEIFPTLVSTPLKRPWFFPIVSSATLALNLAKKASGRVDGFVIELPHAGGHNAPPRGPLTLNTRGEPIYGPRDEVDFIKFRELKMPFWIAGGYASPEKLLEARELGACGVQIGSAFALSRESGITAELRKEVLQKLVSADDISQVVFTDPVASPSGFPFKVIEVEGTLSTKENYEARRRVCDIGLLRNAFVKADGTTGFRCSSEPIDTYLKREGTLETTQGRKCLCNGLMANIGLGQSRAWGVDEKPLLTLGSDLEIVRQYIRNKGTDFSAGEFIQYLTSGLGLSADRPADATL